MRPIIRKKYELTSRVVLDFILIGVPEIIKIMQATLMNFVFVYNTRFLVSTAI